ncbi:MAG: lipoyl synthase [Deltaproteobacteria bacterium]|nr:lipoyl synthase [Deltaproteobacteria bacterium]
MNPSRTSTPKPPWLRVRAPGGERYTQLKETLRRLDLHTVCEEARCPNVGECWTAGTATVMLLGDTCTRGCRFCAVTTGNPGGLVDPREPEHTARALAELDLSYVVLTMVDRDDLLDGGALHVATTVRRIREHSAEMLVETLVGDFAGRREDVVVLVEEGRPDVFAHNVEVVERLTREMRDARCSFARSLDVLRWAKQARPEMPTKSSLMVGIGESSADVHDALARLRDAGVDVVTLGQYLRPSPRHHEVVEYVTPETFDAYAEDARQLGFAFVASGPLVRSSYRAAEAWMHQHLRAAADPETARAGEPAHAAPEEPAFDRYGQARRRHLRVV